MKLINSEQLLKIAVEATKNAGMHALNEKARCNETAEITPHDVKLILDIECQKIAEKTILDYFPDHTIIGEEGNLDGAESNYEWIIDPIDGTVNYSHRFPHWCCSIAVRHKEKVLAGAVFAPELNYMFTATIDGPAKLNNDIIFTSKPDDLSKSLVFTGLNQKNKNIISPTFDALKELALSTQKVRITGSCALDLCYVASGKTDSFVEYGVYLWDYAAGALIAKRAGASLLFHSNKESPPKVGIMCSTPGISSALEKIWRSGLASL